MHDTPLPALFVLVLGVEVAAVAVTASVGTFVHIFVRVQVCPRCVLQIV